MSGRAFTIWLVDGRVALLPAGKKVAEGRMRGDRTIDLGPSSALSGTFYPRSGAKGIITVGRAPGRVRNPA